MQPPVGIEPGTHQHSSPISFAFSHYRSASGGQGAAVQPHDIGGDDVGLEPPHALARLLTDCRTKLRLAGKPFERGRERANISRWDEKAVHTVLNDLRRPARPRRDDGEAGGHPLNHDLAERLGQDRRMDEDVELG